MNGNNIVLVGFMGTGKSTVGQLLAERLEHEYFDSDREVERSCGMTIPELFAAKGEPYFREMETEALQRILGGSGRVVSTGGGSVLLKKNRRLMQERSFVIELCASEETIVSRVEKFENRPLLAGNVKERVAALKRERAGAYTFAHYHLDTDGLHPREAVEVIRDWLISSGYNEGRRLSQ
ncbi:shikimate kinase [Gorillibacterium timonense]|uniref:shikimate kinase n=1 Tax=Gorillibacterium timonense TaxID=1689269 RepID=UPI00071C82AD|nr:shikimate kinase [Gorillibacterium timonense]